MWVGMAARADETNCASCHSFESALSHPVDVRPTMAVPSNLPLEGGRITCQTCHEVSGTHPGKGVRLRAPGGGRSLCIQCHRDGADPKSAHATGTMYAHLSPAPKGGHGVPDRESGLCMSCHDGTIAMESGGRSREAIHPDESHPVGVRYASGGRHRDGNGTLVSPASLDPRLRLFGEEVGCGTCHSPYSKQRNLLVMSNVKSKLCLSCHVE